MCGLTASDDEETDIYRVQKIGYTILFLSTTLMQKLMISSYAKNVLSSSSLSVSINNTVIIIVIIVSFLFYILTIVIINISYFIHHQ